MPTYPKTNSHKLLVKYYPKHRLSHQKPTPIARIATIVAQIITFVNRQITFVEGHVVAHWGKIEYNLNMQRGGQKTRFLGVLALISAIFAAIIAYAPVSAADDSPYRLHISPTQANLGTLEPGSSTAGSFLVRNAGTESFNFTVSVAPYSVSGQNYDADFSTVSKYTELTDWVNLPTKEGHVEPDQSVEVSYSINIPDNAPGGAENAAIIVTMEKPNNANSGVQAEQRVAYLLYSNITGETIESANVTSNQIPSLVFNSPLTATSTVQNSGNVYGIARYLLEVRNVFGGRLVYTNQEEDSNGDVIILGQYIFPETERYNEVSWDEAPLVGLYRVTQRITIYDETSEITKLVLVCPIWLLILSIVAVAFLIFYIIRRIALSRHRIIRL